MADMVHPFVYETSSAPGTTTTANLAGTVAGRVAWAAAFTTGASVYYYMIDDTQAEWGIGVFTSGSPNTLTRTTVLGNTAGTTSRLNFGGTTRVYCDYPGERIVHLDASGNVSLPGALSVRNIDLSTYLRGALSGFTLSRSSATVLAVSAGFATDSTNTYGISLAAFTKSTAGTWASGTGGNGMGSGLTIANSTWYHVFAIINAGASDVYFDTSVSAANKPASTTAFRRIGSFKTDGSAQIIAFTQTGDNFQWAVGIQDFGGTVGSTAAQTQALTVPTGVVVEALFRASLGDTIASSEVLFSALTETDAAPSTATAPGASLSYFAGPTGTAGNFAVMTNTSAQIRFRVSVSTNGVQIVTYGWRDRRGRDD